VRPGPQRKAAVFFNDVHASNRAEPRARAVPAAARGRKAFVPEPPALAIAASVIAVVTAAVVLLTLRLGQILEQLNAKQEERQQRAIIERTRRYGQEGESTDRRRDWNS